MFHMERCLLLLILAAACDGGSKESTGVDSPESPVFKKTFGHAQPSGDADSQASSPWLSKESGIATAVENGDQASKSKR